MMQRVLGIASCDLDPKVKGQIMYFWRGYWAMFCVKGQINTFLGNASPLKPLDIVTLTLQVHRLHDSIHR